LSSHTTREARLDMVDAFCRVLAIHWVTMVWWTRWKWGRHASMTAAQYESLPETLSVKWTPQPRSPSIHWKISALTSDRPQDVRQLLSRSMDHCFLGIHLLC